MYRRSITIALTVALLLLIPSVSAGVQIQAVPSPYTYAVATIGEARTLDPNWAYDTASAALIFNVYETLVEFKGGRTDANIPELATDWTISPDGLTYTFTIRTGVTFTNGNPLTPEDVEYSIERGMVRDRSGGPMWMLFEPLLGVFRSRSYDLSDPVKAAEMGHMIDDAITRDDAAGTVTFSLAAAGVPYPPFIQILSQSWASIFDKEWMTRTVTFEGGATDSFDWPGWVDHKQWVNYNDYAREQDTAYYGAKVSPLDMPSPGDMMGTGPFMFTEWVKGEGGHTTLSRNPDYWGGWPAGAIGTGRYGDFKPSRGYINTYITFKISEWASRKAGFLAGTYDSVYVPRANMGEVWQQPGIRGIYPLPSLVCTAVYFNFNTADGISGLSPYVGTETFDADNDGVPDGIPLNFFADRDARKAFVHLFNGTKFIEEQFLGEAYQPATPIIPGLAPIDPDEARAWHIANRPSIDLDKATSHMQKAWGGEAWSKGFKFTYVYNIGNEPRRITGQMVSETLKLIEPFPGAFVVEVVGVDWPVFLDEIWYEASNWRSIIPWFGIGWLADYPHAHNFAMPFMHTYGDFAYPQSYSNATVDALIEAGIKETNVTKAIEIYMELNQLYLDDAPGFPTVTGFGRSWSRDWRHGWYYNPVFPGTDLYPIWKEELPWEDVNSDGKVDIKDLATAAKAYGSYFIADLPPYPEGTLGTYAANWDSRADVNQDLKVDIKDLAIIAKMYGYVAPDWTPP